MKITLRDVLSFVRRRDFLRVAPACVILLFSGFLIFYSYLFLQVFQVHGLVTSYFPWSWGKEYTTSSSVTSQFDFGVGASAGLGIASAAYLASLLVAYYFSGMRKVVSSLPKVSTPSVFARKQKQDLAPQVVLSPESIQEPAEEEELVQEPVEEEESNENFVFQISERSQQRAAKYLRHKIGSKSRIGAVILLLLSVILLVISYKIPNTLAEVDSVVAFLAALVLIYRDTTHSVQLRVVDRILDSSRVQVSELSSLVNIPDGYIHELKGEKVTDVVLVPMLDGKRTQIDSPKEQIQLTPPGRSLAQLFLREVGKNNPDLQDLKSAMQPIFSESLELSFESSLVLDSEDSVTANIVQPVLKSVCDESNPRYPLSCVICSLLAVLICYASKRRVSIESCHHDSNKKTTKIEFHLEPLPVVAEQKVES